MIHELKTWPEYWQQVFLGKKTFEVRKQDRDFHVGDTLILKEWNPKIETYTGREMGQRIDYILYGGKFGIEKGYCVMSIS